jgi:hypothetical protein
MELTDPVVVYTLDNPVHADVIKNYLLSEGIRCQLEGHDQGGGLFPGFIAVDIKVMVSAVDADRAVRLIEQHEIHKNKKK